MDQDRATTAALGVARSRATRRTLLQSLPVAVAIVGLLVAAIVAAAVQHRSATAPSAWTTAEVSTAPLYLVPTHVPSGLGLFIAAAGGQSAGSPRFTLPAAMQGTAVLFGDAGANDPLTKPMVALITGPMGQRLPKTPDAGDGAVPAHTVARNGREIRVSSIAMWGPHEPELIVAAANLTAGGSVVVAGRNLSAAQLVDVVAELPDTPPPEPVAGPGGPVALSAAWANPALAAVGKGAALLDSETVAGLFLGGLGYPELQLPTGATMLEYAGTGGDEVGSAVAVQVTPGARGRLLSSRFWKGRSEKIMVNGHAAWKFPAPVSYDRALDAASGMPAVEWVQAGHVVRVSGRGVSLAEVRAVAASLHEVSAPAWQQLVQQAPEAQQQGGSSSAEGPDGDTTPLPSQPFDPSITPEPPASRAPLPHDSASTTVGGGT